MLVVKSVPKGVINGKPLPPCSRPPGRVWADRAVACFDDAPASVQGFLSGTLRRADSSDLRPPHHPEREPYPTTPSATTAPMIVLRFIALPLELSQRQIFQSAACDWRTAISAR